MQEKIGNVQIYIDESAQKDMAEDIPYELIKNIAQTHKIKDFDNVIYSEKDSRLMYHISRLKANIVDAMEINSDSEVLELGSDCGIITNALSMKAKNVDAIEYDYNKCIINATINQSASNISIYATDIYKNIINSKKKYDVIIMVGGFESFVKTDISKQDIIMAISKLLKADGIIYFVVDNKYGIKYLSGEKEKYTGIYFESLTATDDKMAKAYSKGEIRKIFEAINFKVEYFYPYPDYTFTTAVYSDEWLPKSGDLDLRRTNYSNSRMLLFNEQLAFENVVKDGEFPVFANSYMAKCTLKREENADHIIYCKSSTDRAEAFSMVTKIKKENDCNVVVKAPGTAQATEHITRLLDNYKILTQAYQGKNISFVKANALDNEVELEFVKGESFDKHIDFLLNSNKIDEALTLISKYFDELLIENGAFKVSDDFTNMFGMQTVELQDAAVKNIDIDALFSNVLYVDSKWISYDYEWLCRFDIPKKFVIYRILRYFLIAPMHSQLRDELFNVFDIDENMIPVYEDMESHFQAYVSNQAVTASRIYESIHGKNHDVITLVDKYDKEHELEIFTEINNELVKLDTVYNKPVEVEYCVYKWTSKLPDNAKKIIVKPAKTMCVVTEFEFLNESKEPLAFTHNGIDRGPDVLFAHFEPQYEVDVSSCSGNQIELKYHIGVITGEYDSLAIVDNKLEEQLIKGYIGELQENFFYTISKPVRKLVRKIRNK